MSWGIISGPQGDNQRDWYDTRQVCVRGHQITNRAQSQPESRKDFCGLCGSRTIAKCERCGADIRGYKHIRNGAYVDSSRPPGFCHSCGRPYPWTRMSRTETERRILEAIRERQKLKSGAVSAREVGAATGLDQHDVIDHFGAMSRKRMVLAMWAKDDIEAELTGEGRIFLSTGETEESESMAARSAPHPVEIQESLARFRDDHPDPAKAAFVMMKFGTTPLHEKAVKALRTALKPFGVAALRADEKRYHDDLFWNVATYMFGCGFGVAIFERITEDDFNPNVSLEVGYMLALRKPVCLLKDKTLPDLNTDLAGKLYDEFDTQDPAKTIPPALNSWLRDKGLT